MNDPMKNRQMLKFPLSLLRAGNSEDSAIRAILWTAVRNVGIGFRATREEIEFRALCDQGEDYWENGDPDLNADDRELVSVGAALLGLGRLPSGPIIQIALTEASQLRDTPYLHLKPEFLWSLLREHSGYGRPDLPEGDESRRRMSWREFRVLCAIISAKVNKHGFTFLGWEAIAARASGFPRNGEASEMAMREEIPRHSELLTRSKIVATVDKLEALKFFMRFRYSRGSRGGYMAYSIRHKTREDLAAAVIDWAGYKEKSVTANRKADLDLCRRLSPPRS
jgi:hypothetical protein